ncbi:hypothetical protein [uncultured Duncaniella sp.]|uniref:hypothetical protein n=1 Tax=uncultured Duncaniella sp. TaxID=2768039 RepID=UPI0026133375|nr:hypothetical protein [uncultured Duncaniella sp.]
MDFSKVKYRAPADFLIDTNIREYDISKANISILFDAGVIDAETYNILASQPKQIREVTVGKMQGRDPTISQKLKEGLAYCRSVFILGNNLSDEEILSINNDSITVIGDRRIEITRVMEHVFFRLDGQYRMFFSVPAMNQHFDFLYGYNKISKEEQFRTRNFGHAAPFHEPYMFDFFRELFKTLQVEGVESAMQLLHSFHELYVNRELDVGYYRRLDQSGMFDVGGINSEYANFQAFVLGNITRADLNISFNESVLRSIMGMLSSYYFQMKG